MTTEKQSDKMVIEYPQEVFGEVRICEFFPAVQGEGTWTGVPSIFVRFSGCDMRCSWCDTRFSSWWANDFERISYEDVVKRCIEIREKNGCKAIICTGGEPSIQPLGLVGVCRRLRAEGFYTTIESNGNNIVEGLEEVLDFASLSPKLPPGAGQAWTNPKSVAWFIDTFGPTRMHLKWVISKQEDLDYLMDWVYPKLSAALAELTDDDIYDIPCIIQPDGYTESLNEYAKRGAWLAELVCNNGPNKYVEFFKRFDTFRVMLQNHRVLWNNERRK
jgi:organic radical activating enzyme